MNYPDCGPAGCGKSFSSYQSKPKYKFKLNVPYTLRCERANPLITSKTPKTEQYGRKKKHGNKNTLRHNTSNTAHSLHFKNALRALDGKSTAGTGTRIRYTCARSRHIQLTPALFLFNEFSLDTYLIFPVISNLTSLSINQGHSPLTTSPLNLISTLCITGSWGTKDAKNRCWPRLRTNEVTCPPLTKISKFPDPAPEPSTRQI